MRSLLHRPWVTCLPSSLLARLMRFSVSSVCPRVTQLAREEGKEGGGEGARERGGHPFCARRSADGDNLDGDVVLLQPTVDGRAGASSLCGTGKSPKVDVYDRVAKPKGSFAPPFPLMASLTHSLARFSRARRVRPHFRALIRIRYLSDFG